MPKILIIIMLSAVLAYSPLHQEAIASENTTIPADAIQLDQKKIDVTGDKKPDIITLYGVQEENTIFYKDIFVKIENPANNKTSIIKGEEGGYYPKLSFCDFEGDKVEDIYVTVESGGSGGFIFSYLYTAINDIVKQLPLPEQLNVKVIYKDNYIVQLNFEGETKIYTVDLSDRKDIYEELGVYKKGKLVDPPEATVNTFTFLEPVDIDRDGVCELRGQQRITGVANADTIALVESLWKLENKQWKLLKSDIKKA